MKKIAFILALLTTSGLANAEAGYRKGKVFNIRVHDTKENPNWAPPLFWFTLEGVTSAGACPLFNGKVLFVMDSDSAMSIILAAEMADREVSIRYDDTQKHVDGWCKAGHLTIGDPVPLM